MTPPIWLVDEVLRRSDLLRAEVARRYAQATADPDADRLHYSQTLALDTMMKTFFARQDQLRAQLESAGIADGKAYTQLLAEITGSQGLWRVFEAIFAQRADTCLLPLLNAADLVAHDCYRPCIDQARAWQLFKLEFREPPLTFLDAIHSPLAAARSSKVQSLGMNAGRFQDQQLPVPINILPIDHVTSLWLFSALAHEVGHHLDQDLHALDKPKLSAELQSTLIMRLGNITSVRRAMWVRWCPEILADAFGVLLGGAGFMYTLGAFVLPLALAGSSSTEQSDYPPHVVRLSLLARSARELGLPRLDEAANWLEASCAALPQPADIASYRNELETVATTLAEPYQALHGHRLAELVPTLEADLERAEQLAAALLDQLSGGNAQLPDALSFPYRLVPPAAQLALQRMPQPSPEALARLHDKALGFFNQIPQPAQALDSGDAPSDSYIRELAERIRFTFELA